MNLFWCFAFNSLFITFLNTSIPDTGKFSSPLSIPLSLSSGFGDLRPDHFHSGIDIKTQGVTGKEVLAPADGYIYRIGVSPGGYGNSLFMRHPSGYSTIYGHLERFSPEIEKYVKAQQYERKSFTVALYPPKDRFSFKKGDVIAYTGNSGASGGPHLHFEIRRSADEVPLNPLLFSFGVTDNIKPVVLRLAVYPLSNHTLINNQSGTRKFDVRGVQGSYALESGNQLTINGPAGFGIKAYDLVDDSYNRCAVYSMELIIDSTEYYKYVMNEFAFSETRYVNSHIDYQSYMKENTYYEKLFVLPNDRLSTYHDLHDRGIIDFRDDKKHHVIIIITDTHKNRSLLSFNVTRGQTETAFPPAVSEPEDLVLMPYNRTNRFRARNISVTIPVGALYDTLRFRFRKDRGTGQMLSSVYYIHDKFTPVQLPYTISIKPDSVIKGKESKMLIIQMSSDFRKSPLLTRYADGYLTADALSFGMFYAGIDTVPPAIYTNGLADGADLSGRSEIRVRILDDLSGIRDYFGEIDGKWALFEYDPRYDQLKYKFDPERIIKGGRHTLSLRVADNRDNVSEFKCNFVW